MAHNVYKRMVYSFMKEMWHNLTEPSKVPMKAEAILDQLFGGGYSIELRPASVPMNGSLQETGQFGIVRTASVDDPEEQLFGFCTERFHPLQPREVAQSFDANVQEPAETMAFLDEGKDMFISWKMPSFDVMVGGKADPVDMYGIVRTGFDTLKGTRLFTSIYRPVCANTINLAEGWAKGNTAEGSLQGNIWKGKGVNKNLLRDLGYWMKHVHNTSVMQAELLKSFFGKLAQTPIKSDEQAIEILYNAYPPIGNNSEFYPVELRDAKSEKIEDFNSRQEFIRDGIYQLFAGAGTDITPDYWGMLNSTSEYFCHVMPSKRPIAESVMFGGRQKQIMQMVKVLTKQTA